MPRTGNDSLDIREIYESLQWVFPAINPGIGQIEPPARYKRTGLIAYADGTNWNPNTQGAGHYRWDGAAWVKLLEPDDTFTTSINADKIDTFHASQTPTASYLLAAGSDATMPIKPIWDKTVTGSAVTSVTTDGEVALDGNTHGGYIAEFVIVNNSGSTAVHRLYYNNDTTNTNYYFTDTNGAAYGNDAILGITGGILNGQRYIFDGKIYITPEGAVGFVGERQKDLMVNEQNVTMHKKSAVIANLTRIDIVSSVANGIGINSRFRLWRRK